VTIKPRNKTPRGWIDQPRTTNLRHQTSDSNAALYISCCLFTLCLLGYSYVVAIWQSEFCLLFKLIKFILICLAWEQYKLAQIVYSVAIWFLNDWIETQIKKILKRWKANQKNFEALIRCVSNLSPNSHVTIDTIRPIVCRTQSKCFEYVTLQSACGFTNGHIEIHENSLEYPGVIDTKSDEMNKN